MPYSASCALSSSAKGYNLLLRLVNLSQVPRMGVLRI
jgi:hypothetical protein